MRPEPPVSLRLTTEFIGTIDHHCPVCLFLHGTADYDSRHNSHFGKDISRPPTAHSVLSLYSQRTVDHFAFFGSTKGLRVRVVPTAPQRQHTLRRKDSPTDVSLRELRALQEQQRLVRQQRSEERLQQVYEDQILAYLESPLAEKGVFESPW